MEENLSTKITRTARRTLHQSALIKVIKKRNTYFLLNGIEMNNNKFLWIDFCFYIGLNIQLIFILILNLHCSDLPLKLQAELHWKELQCMDGWMHTCEDCSCVTCGLHGNVDRFWWLAFLFFSLDIFDVTCKVSSLLQVLEVHIRSGGKPPFARILWILCWRWKLTLHHWINGT